jgi:hypothetical protein
VHSIVFVSDSGGGDATLFLLASSPLRDFAKVLRIAEGAKGAEE